jgi:hypothetical protein
MIRLNSLDRIFASFFDDVNSNAIYGWEKRGDLLHRMRGVKGGHLIVNSVKYKNKSFQIFVKMSINHTDSIIDVLTEEIKGK